MTSKIGIVLTALALLNVAMIVTPLAAAEVVETTGQPKCSDELVGLHCTLPDGGMCFVWAVVCVMAEST